MKHDIYYILIWFYLHNSAATMTNQFCDWFCCLKCLDFHVVVSSCINVGTLSKCLF